MNRDETGRVLRYVYQQQPNPPKIENAEATIDAWAATLLPYPYEAVSRAAIHWCRRSKAIPHPSDLIKIMTEAFEGAIPSKVQVWRALTSPSTADDRVDWHPVMRHAWEISGGLHSLAYLNERDMQRAIDGAYFQALREFEIDQDPELRRAPDSERGLRPGGFMAELEAQYESGDDGS